MKTFRKNIDLDSKTVAILQIEGSLRGFGTLKPFLENLITEFAQKAIKARPGVYKHIIESGQKEMKSKKTLVLKKK